jgi:CRP/FNR family transcriptional regulator, nitrogen oxide reductase regulator
MKTDLMVETLKRCWLFSDLHANAVEEIAALSIARRFSKNEVIFHEGDPSDFLYIVSSGVVKQFKSTDSGRLFTTVISTSSNALLPIALFGASAYFLSAKAISDTVALVVSKREFLSFVEKYPIVKDKVLLVMGKVIDSAYERLSDFVGEPASRRVLNVLYMLYSKFGNSVSFNREEVADMAGTTVETTVRVLKNLKAANIIRSRRGGIVILDERQFRQMCRSSYVVLTSNDEPA